MILWGSSSYTLYRHIFCYDGWQTVLRLEYNHLIDMSTRCLVALDYLYFHICSIKYITVIINNPSLNVCISFKTKLLMSLSIFLPPQQEGRSFRAKLAAGNQSLRTQARHTLPESVPLLCPLFIRRVITIDRLPPGLGRTGRRPQVSYLILDC